jgi:hypothetical protein
MLLSCSDNMIVCLSHHTSIKKLNKTPGHANCRSPPGPLWNSIRAIVLLGEPVTYWYFLIQQVPNKADTVRNKSFKRRKSIVKSFSELVVFAQAVEILRRRPPVLLARSLVGVNGLSNAIRLPSITSRRLQSCRSWIGAAYRHSNLQ